MPPENAPVTTPDVANSDKRYFTVLEANRALPYVSRIVEDVTRVYGRIVELRGQLERAAPSGDADKIEPQYESLMDRLSDLIDELREVGVDLKDFQKGLVDFPALHEDREVQLCWKKGEDQIEYWHEADAGYAGRQAIELLEPGAGG